MKTALIILLAALTAVFVVFVWPTAYFYIPVAGPDGAATSAQVNRFTGQARLIYGNVWLDVETVDDRQAPPAIARPYGPLVEP